MSNQIFVISKSGVVFTPHSLELLRSYTRYYLYAAQQKLAEYQSEVPVSDQDEQLHTQAEREIQHATEVLAGLDEVGDETKRM